MRAAVALGNVVGKRQHVLVVGIVPPQSDFDIDAVALAAHDDRRRDERLLGAVEIAHEGFDAAFIMQLVAFYFGMARVGEDDAHAGI